MAEWFNENVESIIPQGTIDLIPSAELSAAQCVDAGNGDPLKYEYHDLLFKAWVERWDRAMPEDILMWVDNIEPRKLEKELGWNKEEGIIETLFNNSLVEFIEDLERWWNNYQGLAVAKRIQAPPIVTVSRRAFGFDHREAQFGASETERYKALGRYISGVYS
jgi:NAD+ synthase (glutamine-hydrolysing)